MSKKHPEQLDGEIYLGDFDPLHYKRIGWKTKRRGMNLYKQDSTGEWSDIAPAFVQRVEIEEAYENGASYVKSALEELLTQ